MINRNKFPYSEEYLESQKEKAKEMMIDAWDKFVEEMRMVNLGNDLSIMNEGVRIIKQNSVEYNSNLKFKTK